MSLECKIELNKKDGIKVTVIDADNNKEQTIVLDGSKLILTVKDQSNTSIITQEPDTVSIKCKTFKVDADAIETKSANSTKLSSDGSMDLAAQGAMSLKGSQNVAVEATNGLTLKGLTVAAEAQTSADLKGATVSVKGETSTSVEGATVSVKGQTTTNVQGLMVSVKSDAIMSVEGMVTTVKGQILNGNGTLVNLGP